MVVCTGNLSVLFVSMQRVKRRDNNKDKKKRSNKPSLKQQIKCPFYIKWSFINKSRRSKKTDIMHRVVITGIDSTHTCQLSNAFFHKASRSTTRTNKFDLKKMDAVVNLLKNTPNLSPISLRPLLHDCLPTYILTTGKFIGNFRNRVALFHAKNTDLVKRNISIEEVNHLCLKTSVSVEETKVLDDTMVMGNF